MKYMLRLLDKIPISHLILYKYIYIYNISESCLMDMKALILTRNWELEISIIKKGSISESAVKNLPTMPETQEM